MIRNSKFVHAFTLVEVMISLALGLLLTLGIVSLFSSTAALNRQQDSMARMQENGRYAMSTLSNDLRMTAGQFCSNNGGQMTNTANVYQDYPRSPMVNATSLKLPGYSSTNTVTAPPGWTPGTEYPLSPRYLLQGYSCPVGQPNCKPALPYGVNTDVPVVGTTNGTRPLGSDVLTVRYLNSPGWSITEHGSTCANTGIVIKPWANDPPLNFAANDLAMISGCGNSEIISGAYAGGTYTPGGNFGPISCPASTSEGRIFNFTKDFVSATYFLRFDADPNDPSGQRVISSLYRSTGGGNPPQQIVQGVERLNFLYRLEDSNGFVHELTAAQITDNTAGLTCPPPPAGYSTAAPEPGCLWRAVQAVEIFMLLNTVDNMAASAIDQSFRYSFDNAGNFVGVPAPLPAPPPATLISGVTSGQMMRREFRSLVSVRNYNP